MTQTNMKDISTLIPLCSPAEMVLSHWHVLNEGKMESFHKEREDKTDHIRQNSKHTLATRLPEYCLPNKNVFLQALLMMK